MNADKRGYLLFVIPVKTGIHSQYAVRITQYEQIGFVFSNSHTGTEATEK